MRSTSDTYGICVLGGNISTAGSYESTSVVTSDKINYSIHHTVSLLYNSIQRPGFSMHSHLINNVELFHTNEEDGEGNEE